MQEQAGATVSRGKLRLGLGFIIFIVLVWLLVWLIFIRNTSRPSSSHSTSGQQHHATGGQTSTNGTGAQSPSINSSGSTNNQPSQLANTGAGNVLIPVMVASLTGGVLYQVRLRKKLSS